MKETNKVADNFIAALETYYKGSHHQMMAYMRGMLRHMSSNNKDLQDTLQYHIDYFNGEEK